MFADDRVIIPDSEDTLKTGPHERSKIILIYNSEISMQKKIWHSVVSCL
jgi:hypothetical protein